MLANRTATAFKVVQMRRYFSPTLASFALALLGGCSYAVDGVRYITQEDYVSGAAALTPGEAVQAGLYCNLGPGKRPDEI